MSNKIWKPNYYVLTILWFLVWTSLLCFTGVKIALLTNALFGAIIWIFGSTIISFIGKIFIPALRAPGETKQTWILQSIHVLIAAGTLLISLFVNKFTIYYLPDIFFTGWWSASIVICIQIAIFLIIYASIEKLFNKHMHNKKVDPISKGSNTSL